MALSDGAASAIDAFRLNQRTLSHYAQREKEVAAEAARASGQMTYADEAGDTWTYVYIDGETVRIQKADIRTSRVTIPDALDGKPVTAIAPEALTKQTAVEELIIPDSVTSIGGGAFRGCTGIKKVKFPRYLADFDSGWLHYCDAVEEMTLPGEWENIRASIFDLPHLRILHIGAGTSKVEPGAFQKSHLETITVDAANESLKTDGRGIYTRDGSTLVVLGVPADRYDVLAGTRVLGRKAFSSYEDLCKIVLPDSVEVVGPFSYTRTGVEVFEAPRSLKTIDEKAFFRCLDLERVKLNDGLLEIGEEAFAGTAIRELRLPSTLQLMGKRIGNDTALTYSGPGASLTIAPDAEYLSLDEQGVLYSTLCGEKSLARIVDPAATKIIVQEGTRRVLEGAAARHLGLEAIKFPEGMTTIEREAFKGCRSLYWVELPDSVSRIEDEAFMDSMIQSLHLPASLTYLGEKALTTYGAHHADTVKPSLTEVDVPESLRDRFFVESHLLCRRLENNTVRILVCLGGEKIKLPDDTTAIDEYAFNGQHGIRDLSFTNRIRNIGMCGFAICCYVEHIHIDCVEPVDGHSSFDLYFPFNDRAVQQTKLVFGMMRSVDVQRIIGAYDQCIANGAGLQGGHGDSGMTLYDQSQRMLSRLADPVYLSRVHKSLFLSFLKNGIEDISFEIAKKDDRRAFDTLLDFGFINEENLLRVIDRVQTVQDASMTGYLLEVRRRLFGADILDFDL